jgi:hypothetical protein
MQDAKALVSLKINNYTLPIHELKTATKFNICTGFQDFEAEHAIIVASCIQVCNVATAQL